MNNFNYQKHLNTNQYSVEKYLCEIEKEVQMGSSFIDLKSDQRNYNYQGFVLVKSCAQDLICFNLLKSFPLLWFTCVQRSIPIETAQQSRP